MTIKTEVKDLAAIQAACKRNALPPAAEGKWEMYEGSVNGIGVQLPGWTYPAVFDLTTGAAKFDTFNGRWGDTVHMDSFLQAYAVEKAKLEARKLGHTATEATLPDGSIKLTLTVAG